MRVLALFGSRFPDAEIGFATSPQLDLGVDSLAWLEIAQTNTTDFFGRLEKSSWPRDGSMRDYKRKQCIQLQYFITKMS